MKRKTRLTFTDLRGFKRTYTNPVSATQYVISLCRKFRKSLRKEILDRVSKALVEDERCDIDFGVLRFTKS